MTMLEIKLDTQVEQFISSEIGRKVKEELAKAKELWQKNWLLEQVSGVWEKEWEKEWREIWQ